MPNLAILAILRFCGLVSLVIWVWNGVVWFGVRQAFFGIWWFLGFSGLGCVLELWVWCLFVFAICLVLCLIYFDNWFRVLSVWFGFWAGVLLPWQYRILGLEFGWIFCFVLDLVDLSFCFCFYLFVLDCCWLFLSLLYLC